MKAAGLGTTDRENGAGAQVLIELRTSTTHCARFSGVPATAANIMRIAPCGLIRQTGRGISYRAIRKDSTQCCTTVIKSTWADSSGSSALSSPSRH